MALAGNSGSIDFYDEVKPKFPYLQYHLSGVGTTLANNPHQQSLKYAVKAQTLAEYLSEQNIQSIDLIKLDTEGSELEILRSGIGQLKKFRPILITEILFGSAESEIESFMNELDYISFLHEENGLREVTSIQTAAHNTYRNYFFVPREKISLVAQHIIKSS